ncbi:sigma-54 dependent transcriptional regulator [Pendulispora brunnea]|uniref:Sigma-54 dependent transcriptional regulator n=1 Tax=Pendulispora brunnea TaxID=2905690 RepID=A0ABZ2KC06_9BACT
MTADVLLVDDDQPLCETLTLGLGKRGFRAQWRTSAGDALHLLESTDFDVVVTDLNMPEMNGIELCERIALNRPDVPVIVLTAFGNLDSAVAAIRAGAYDFISKPIEIDALAIAVDRAANHRRLREEVKRLRLEVLDRPRDRTLIGESTAMRRTQDLISRVAGSDATILVTGESGTGKEVVARAIHDRSRRQAGPFIAINCAAVPESLLESELFGHIRGAFTDAKSASAGLFVQANGGTLFLDEIGDMPPSIQPKLLRALQERKIRPLGSKSEVSIDVRIVTATNRDLESAIDEKRFREDLYYRINVVHIPLPPLRARQADILPLALHFIRMFAAQSEKNVTGLSKEVAQKLLAYAWPGNVRELQNSIERAVALTRFEEIRVDDLPEKIRDYRFSHVLIAGNDPAELVPLEEVERRYILRVLDAVAGNKAAAARVLGLERKTLYRKLERYELREKAQSE